MWRFIQQRPWILIFAFIFLYRLFSPKKQAQKQNKPVQRVPTAQPRTSAPPKVEISRTDTLSSIFKALEQTLADNPKAAASISGKTFTAPLEKKQEEKPSEFTSLESTASERRNAILSNISFDDSAIDYDKANVDFDNASIDFDTSTNFGFEETDPNVSAEITKAERMSSIPQDVVQTTNILGDILANPESIRRAILFNEILGSPKSLRR